MVAIENISLLLIVMTLVACGASEVRSKALSSNVLVSRILAERETESAIARCVAIADYVLNEDRLLLPKESSKERVAVQSVWIQAAQVKTDSPFGPNTGRVTKNHFELYNKHISNIKSVTPLDRILSEFSSCSKRVEDAAGGFETLLGGR